MQVILAIATILGGVAAITYLVEKARTIPWERVRFARQHRRVTSERAALPAGAPRSLEFPPELEQRVRTQYPDYRLPTPTDLVHEWATQYDPATMFPLACKGDFLGSGRESWATFLFGKDERYKVVVMAGDQLVELTVGEGLPQTLFLRTVPPGVYKPGGSTRTDSAPWVRRLRLIGNGINFGTFESADSIFYWNPRRQLFQQVWMSD